MIQWRTLIRPFAMYFLEQAPSRTRSPERVAPPVDSPAGQRHLGVPRSSAGIPTGRPDGVSVRPQRHACHPPHPPSPPSLLSPTSPCPPPHSPCPPFHPAFAPLPPLSWPRRRPPRPPSLAVFPAAAAAAPRGRPPWMPPLVVGAGARRRRAPMVGWRRGGRQVGAAGMVAPMGAQMGAAGMAAAAAGEAGAIRRRCSRLRAFPAYLLWTLPTWMPM